MTAYSFHREFELLLPKIKEAVRFSFRGLNPCDRDEAVADLIAATWSAWSGLIKRGRSLLEVGPIGILNFAVKYLRGVKRVGNPGCGRAGWTSGSIVLRERSAFAGSAWPRRGDRES
jgi:hypothetical protein